jgi:hypothetical protein
MEIRFPNWEHLKDARSYARRLNDVQERYYTKGKRLHYVVKTGDLLNLDWLMGIDEDRKNEPKYLKSYMVVIA